jgi:N-acetyl-alpha-D-glucosaminyl L-malate synthase BshA
VIPNFVNTDVWKPVDSKNLRCRFAPNDEKVFVHASNFRPVKRVVDVIAVFARVRKEVEAKLVMVGDGPDRAEAERMSRELGIADDVQFLGKQNGLVEIFSACDIFLMPSQNESFGLSALEAMACGLPVLSTSVGGLSELNMHGTTGYISEIGDIDRMARYAIELCKDERRYSRFSAAAQERAETQFSAKDIVPVYEAYYERILHGE